MRRVSMLLFVLLGVVSLWGKDTLTVVVMAIENRLPEQDSLDSRTLTEIVELHVVNLKCCQVVERDKLDRILAEQKLNTTGLTEKQVAKIGSLAGASKAILGSLSKIGRNYILIIRMIDTSTATIDEVAELRDASLERLIDRIDEPVRALFRSSSLPSPSPQKAPSRPQPEGNITSPSSSSPNQAISPSEETDEDTLARLINEVKSKLHEKQASQTTSSPSQTNTPSASATSSSSYATVKQESDLLWESLARNRWGIILQIGIFPEAQIYPSSWNFAGFGWGLFSLENRLYIGYEFAVIQPVAVIMAGYQVGLFPVVNRYLFGVQHGFLNSVRGSATGWQSGFINTVSDHLHGFQSGFINTSGDVTGVQIGFINSAREVHGVQIGFLNSTKRLYGVQIGWFNIASQNTLPFMIGLNIGF